MERILIVAVHLQTSVPSVASSSLKPLVPGFFQDETTEIL
jgi:hypothetical protein